VLETVLPAVSARFPRVQPCKGQIGVGGYSLGGLMSAYALFTRRDWFDRTHNNVIMRFHS
jgi:predicted alpha/beta superfamily hydrolase